MTHVKKTAIGPNDGKIVKSTAIMSYVVTTENWH